MASDAELPEHEKAFLQFHITMPEGPSLRVLLQDPEERRKLGEHIHRGKLPGLGNETLNPRGNGIHGIIE